MGGTVPLARMLSSYTMVHDYGRVVQRLRFLIGIGSTV